MGAKVSNCGHDEKGKYSGGKAGDQTGTEYQIKDWYKYPGGWDAVFRFKNEKYASELAAVAKAAANNNNVGYDQGDRGTYYMALKKANWDPSKIGTKCEADCSASTSTNLIAVGNRLNIEELKELSPSLTTSTLKDALIKTGLFKIISVNSEKDAKAGDINLKIGHHVNITVVSGSAIATARVASPTLKKGSEGAQVKALQENLNKVMAAGLEVDGIFGSKTEAAVKKFQKKYNLTIDGIYGPKTYSKLKELIG